MVETRKLMDGLQQYLTESKNAEYGRSVNSTSVDWNTPPKYVDPINKFFNNNISLDPCSNKHSLINAKTKYMLPENDGLKSSWNFPTIFVNPPYGRDMESKTSIKNWIAKCAEANANYDSEVLALIPVAPNTNHWNIIFDSAMAICFLKDKRLRFYKDGEEYKKGSPQAIAIVYWGNDYKKFRSVFSAYGKVLKNHDGE